MVGSGALGPHHHGAVLLEPPLVELLEPGLVLLDPMLPVLLDPMSLLEPDGLASELGLAAELSVPLTGPEGEVALLLSVAEPLLGLVAALEPMLLLELPAVEPPAPESWAKAAGAKAATDNAKPAPSK